MPLTAFETVSLSSVMSALRRPSRLLVLEVPARFDSPLPVLKSSSTVTVVAVAQESARTPCASRRNRPRRSPGTCSCQYPGPLAPVYCRRLSCRMRYEAPPLAGSNAGPTRGCSAPPRTRRPMTRSQPRCPSHNSGTRPSGGSSRTQRASRPQRPLSRGRYADHLGWCPASTVTGPLGRSCRSVRHGHAEDRRLLLDAPGVGQHQRRPVDAGRGTRGSREEGCVTMLRARPRRTSR